MASDLLDLDSSLDVPGLCHLSTQQQLRLTTLLDDYLQNLEHGIRPDVAAVIQANPDLAETYSAYLSKLEALFGLTSHQRDNLALASANELPFKQLGDFELLREMGRGGMGIVYEANQISLGRRVALKLLSLGGSLDPKQIARFQNESRAAGLLQHPNIVPVYSIGFQQGVHFYAMQLVDGQSLDQWIESRRAEPTSFAWESIVNWMVQAAEALHAAHDAGIVHRDIKPSNLLLDLSGRIWVTDFGLARCTNSTSVTVSGDLVGTVRYMSPEQASGRSALVDSGADIYGLGLTLYEMLTLQPAIEGSEPSEIIKRIAEGSIKPLRLIRPDLPRSLALVVGKALSLERYSRYETAQQFADDLRRVLLNQPTLAKPATALERIGNWVVRHQRAAAIGFSAFAIVFVGLVIAFSIVSASKREVESISLRNEKNEKLARDAIDRLGPQMAELLGNVPSAELERKQLLEEILRYYQVYAAGAQGSPDLQRSLAVALGKIGVLHGELGSTQESVTALRESERVFSELAQQNRLDFEVRLEWSVSLNNLGQALHRNGEIQEASELIRQAIEIQNELPRLQTDLQIRQRIASSWANLGLLLTDQLDYGSAEQAYDNALRMLAVDDRSAEDVNRVLQLSQIQTNLCGLLTKIRPLDGISVAQQAIELQTAALKLFPNHAKLSKQTAQSLNALGSAYIESKQYRAALEAYTQALDIVQQLVTRWPEQPDFQSDLAATLNQLAVVYGRLNRWSEARETVLQALAQQQSLAEKFAEDAEVQSATGSMFSNYSIMCQQNGQLEQGLEALRQSIQFHSKAVELAPQVSRYNETLKKQRINLELAQSRRK